MIRRDPETTHLPIIVCSADPRLHEKAANLQDQRCHILEKPFDVDRLVDMIKTALDAAARTSEEHLDESAE